MKKNKLVSNEILLSNFLVDKGEVMAPVTWL
jgi:hypothetical protein